MTYLEIGEMRRAIATCESQCRGIHAAQIVSAHHRQRNDDEIAGLAERVGFLEEALAALATMVGQRI